MKSPVTILFCTFLLLMGCKNETTEPSQTTNQDLLPFSEFVENYYQEGLERIPLNATKAGDDKYNDRFVNFLDSLEIEKTKKYYTTYSEALKNYPDSTLTESERMS